MFMNEAIAGETGTYVFMTKQSLFDITLLSAVIIRQFMQLAILPLTCSATCCADDGAGDDFPILTRSDANAMAPVPIGTGSAVRPNTIDCELSADAPEPIAVA
jgi:hypothetical protein